MKILLYFEVLDLQISSNTYRQHTSLHVGYYYFSSILGLRESKNDRVQLSCITLLVSLKDYCLLFALCSWKTLYTNISSLLRRYLFPAHCGTLSWISIWESMLFGKKERNICTRWLITRENSYCTQMFLASSCKLADLWKSSRFYAA
jgi:hypothetical protein